MYSELTGKKESSSVVRKIEETAAISSAKNFLRGDTKFNEESAKSALNSAREEWEKVSSRVSTDKDKASAQWYQAQKQATNEIVRENMDAFKFNWSS